MSTDLSEGGIHVNEADFKDAPDAVRAYLLELEGKKRDRQRNEERRQPVHRPDKEVLSRYNGTDMVCGT